MVLLLKNLGFCYIFVCRLQGRLLCTLAPRQDTGVDAAWSEVQFCSRKLHLRQYPDIPISAGLLWNGPTPVLKAIEALPFSPLGVSSRWELFLRLQCHRCCCWVGRYSFLPQGNSCASCRCCKGIDAAQEALPRLQAVSCWSLVEDRMTYIFNLTTTLFHASYLTSDIRGSYACQYV